MKLARKNWSEEKNPLNEATMQIYNLLDGVETTGPGNPVKVDPARMLNGGSIGFQLSGITNANVILEGTISEDSEVAKGMAVWAPIQNASWSADTADGLFTGFTHIRGNCTMWVAGKVYLKALI